MSLLVLGDGFDHFRCRSSAARKSATDSGERDPAYLSVILSAPTAIPNEASPVCMSCAMLRTDIKPEEQSRLTVDTGTWAGIPAAIAAAREM